MRLAELVQSRPDPLWTLMKQCGVDDAVVLLDGAEQETRWLRAVGAPPPTFTDERPWGEAAIKAHQERLADHGLTMAAIEDTPPLDAVRLGGPQRDEQVSHVIEQVRAMGRLGVPVLCYNWMAVTSWARTDVAVRIRGGALSTGYTRAGDLALPPVVEPGSITEDQLWDGLAYFLDAVAPEAEQAGVRLALHPDDPPRAESRGVPRIIRSVEAFRRVLDLHPSPANAVTLCQGNVALMTDDLPAVIRELGRRDAIAFVHFRDVRGTADDFVETFHDDGQTDLAACVEAYAEVGFEGPLRPDHVPTLAGEDNHRPGYATMGRLFALGYIKALRQVAYGR